jgi:hypothetical protein
MISVMQAADAGYSHDLGSPPRPWFDHPESRRLLLQGTMNAIVVVGSSGVRLYALPESVEVIIFIVIWSALFVLIGAVGLLSTWPKELDLGVSSSQAERIK